MPLKFLLALLSTVLTLPATAEKKVKVDELKHPVHACLFKVEGNGLKKPSYLFGTIHLGDPRVIKLHPNAEKAFTASDAFYAEIDLDPAAQIAIVPKMMRKDGKTLTQAIGPELTKELEKALKAINPALTPAALNTLQTWAVAISLPALELQLQGKAALDMVLYQRAMKEGKKTGALETADAQVGLFAKFTEKEQQSILKDSIKMVLEEKEAGKSAVDKLLGIYLTGDVNKIGEFMVEEMAKADTDPELTKRLLKALLDDRNIGMADKAHEFMQETPGKTHFFAVGAAHYTGKTAVQDLLKKKGYKITPLFN